MFKNLLSFWSGKDFISSVLDSFGEMLQIGEEMYERATRVLLGERVEGDRQRLYDLDQQINDLERNIRRRIVEHLAVNPSMDTNVCLVLMSVVKDAERVGDYIKNIQELADMAKEPLDRALVEKYFGNTVEEIGTNFSKTAEAFLQSDENLAKEIISHKHAIAKRCDQILNDLAESDLPANIAVCFAVLTRSLKRVTAHMMNISSAVIMPISDLDYFDEKHLEDKE